jgi:hypothetical protein
MAPKWYDFQEEICEYFKSLGFEAETNKTINGVRTKSDIDVLVKTKFIGQELTWIIEVKKWKSKVNKLQVMGLRSVVNDFGADRGFIISEVGFQKGAFEAANKTNISLFTFEQLKLLTKDFVETEILKSYQERINLIGRRYWSHSKRIRIHYELRHDLYDMHYSIPFVTITANNAIQSALKQEYPINLNTILAEQYGELIAENFQQLINWMNINFNMIDKKILDAELKMQKDGNFQPKIR